MTTQQKNRQGLWLLLFFILSIFVGGRWNVPLAAWLAPVFAIRFYRQSGSGRRAFLWIWGASTLSTVINFYQVTPMASISPLIEPVFFTLITSITIVPFAVDRFYHRRWVVPGRNKFLLTLVFPISVTAIDYFSATGSPFGSFGATAYSQEGFNSLMQITTITGLWGIPFLFSWFATVVNYAWEASFQRESIQRGLVLYATVWVLVVGFGLTRVAVAEVAPHEVQIGGFSLTEEPVNTVFTLLENGDSEGFREATSTIHADQLAQIQQMAQAGAEIVVLQEGAGMGFAEEVEVLMANARSVAREEGIYLVLPTVTMTPAGEEKFHNVVHVIDPAGDIVLEHYKYGGTQFEGAVTGSGELQTVDTPYGKLSAVICWDADFPQTMKQAGEQEVDLLFVPSNDWFEVRDIHADMATFRAVENGVPIFRQTGGGVSVVTDVFGQIVNRVDVFDEADSVAFASEQLVMTPVGSMDTLFPQTGQAFGGVMVLNFIGLVGFAWVKRAGNKLSA